MERVFIPMGVGFRGFGGKGSVSHPGLLVDFNGVFFCPWDVFGGGFLVILNGSGIILCAIITISRIETRALAILVVPCRPIFSLYERRVVLV